MRLAILSDVHANLEALDACLKHARDHGAEGFAFLGDLVGYGGDPGAVVDRVAELAAAGAPVVMGNHDAAALGEAEGVEGDAKVSAQWTAAQLSAGQRDFLRGLPMRHELGRTLLVHASAAKSQEWPYVLGVDAALESLTAAPQFSHTFVGHTHLQRLYYLGSDGKAYAFKPTVGVAIPVAPPRRWLGLVGSVGQPRDRDATAAYALFDGVKSRLTFNRVPYDWERAANRIRAAGLPDFYATRLAEGV